MLSCLTRQAKLLEKELKDLRKETIKLRRETAEAKETVTVRDERVEVLEAQLACLQEEHAKCTRQQLEPEPEPEQEAEMSNEQVNELLAKLTELGQRLSGKSRKLTVMDYLLPLANNRALVAPLSSAHAQHCVPAGASDFSSENGLIDVPSPFGCRCRS